MINQSQIEELGISTFIENNPQCECSIEESNLIIEKPWGANCNKLSIPLANNEFIRDLNRLYFRYEFDAIFHLDTNTAEFIYAFIDPKDEDSKYYLDRKFEIRLEGRMLACGFAEPSERLMNTAKHFYQLPSEQFEIVPQMIPFSDYHRQDELSAGYKAYFESRVPRSFFIRFEAPILELDLRNIANHINLIMGYYDRRTPIIIIREDDKSQVPKPAKRLRFIEGDFPSVLSLDVLDEFLLETIQVARQSSARFAFVYYYQALEHASFYFLEGKLRRQVRHILRDPSLSNCSETKMSELLSIFSEQNCEDETKIRKVIDTFCDPRIVWKEIVNDKDFFCSQVEFEGDLVIPALISNDTTEDSWASMWMPKLFEQLKKIRNGLVHAREKRQSNSILPSKSNNRKLERYLPIIARVVEQVTIYKE